MKCEGIHHSGTREKAYLCSVKPENAFGLSLNVWGKQMEKQKPSTMDKDNKFTNGYAASISANATSDNMQWTKYHSPKGGHGFAAEDGNALWERILGHKVEVVGMDNAKNGADLLIDGTPVQLKYHKDAYSTTEACFDAEGLFRYDGKVIMVPKDQYEEVVARLRRKIAEGKVAGVMDPDAAEQMVRKGRLTRRQVQNLKRCGTKESLAFDVLTQAQVAGIVGGVSAFWTFVNAKRNGAGGKQAAVAAGKEFGKAGGKTLACGVATQQFLRTTAGRKSAVAATLAVRKGVNAVCKSGVGKKVVEKVAQGVGGKVVKGAAARTVATRAIRGNVITSSIVFAIDSVPDTYRLCTGKMSAKEFGKSRATGAAGVAGGSIGYLAGMAIGTAILPGIGTTIGGFVGGILGGIGGTAGARELIVHSA